MHAVSLSIFLLCISNVFMTLAWYAHLKEPFNLDYLWAALRIIGAVFFIFRSRLGA
jgi:hypothetical protein